MKRNKPLLFLILFLLSFHLFPQEVGEPAPPFANPDLKGNFVMSNQVLGKGWVLLDFFATWCEPCKKELPDLEKLYAEFQEQGPVFLIFAADKEGTEKVAPFFASYPVTMPVLIDRYQVTYTRYGVKGIPSLFLIDPEGIIVFKYEGYSQEAILEIRNILRRAFKISQ